MTDSGPAASNVLPANAGASLPQFAAMEYYALILNRTFNVFIADTMLCGAKVGGIVQNPTFPSTAMLDQKYWVSSDHAVLYERIDVTSPHFLELNSVNFQTHWADVSQIEFNPAKKWGMGNVPHSGRIFVHLKSGKPRELILLGRQDGTSLKTRLDETIRAAARR